MRRTWIGTIGGIAGTALAMNVSALGAEPTTGDADAKAEDRPAPVAVVELFTSEGCSSCPPAEELVAELSREAKAGVFLLAFHVDYWNYLGHADRFSTPAHSRRQRDYAKAWKSERVYTPQMVVNGTSEFVGSDGERARREIALALRRPSDVGVTIDAADAPTDEAKGKDATTPDAKAGEGAKKTDAANDDQTKKGIKEPRRASGKRTLGVSFTLRAAEAGMIANVALVENGLVTKVTRGENAGRTLKHERVVRSFASVTLGKEATARASLDVPSDVALERASVVVYVQDRGTMRVLGAAAAGTGSRSAPNPP